MAATMMASTTTSIANLSRDLIVTILLRLPIKSLFRCLLVSRSFQAIIKSHDFIDLQSKHGFFQQDYIFIYHYQYKAGLDGKSCTITEHTKRHFTFHDQTFSTCTDTEFPCADSTLNLTQLGCCRGLVCMQSYYNAYFWNPAIRVCRTINVFHRESTPAGSFHFGFGFVPKINDFKLVRMKCKDLGVWGKFQHEVDVYTLSSNSWRRIENNVSGTVVKYPTVCVNGVVYWHACVRSSEVVISRYILGFSLDDEVFHEITLPGNSNFSELLQLQEYKGSLCVCGIRGGECEIWVKKNQSTAYSSWVKLHTSRGSFNKYFWLMKDDKILFVRNRRLALYDPTNNGQVKEDLPPLKNLDLPEIDRFNVVVMNYKPSLVLLEQAI